MASSNKGFTSLESSSLTNDAGENNENQLNPELAFKLKKRLASKHFMCPTVFASFKAAIPKKKIFAEKNQTLDVTEQVPISSNFDSKPLKYPVVGTPDDDDDVENKFAAESSLQPYDPIKNYLSPRPKFLCYNPNRHRKMFRAINRRKGEDEDEDEREEEFVEFDEDGAWSLLFLKLLLMVIALIITTLVISEFSNPSSRDGSLKDRAANSG